MAEIINLRQARKAKTRAEKDARAAENRAKFGRAKAERSVGDAEKILAERRLEGHRLRDSEKE